MSEPTMARNIVRHSRVCATIYVFIIGVSLAETVRLMGKLNVLYVSLRMCFVKV